MATRATVGRMVHFYESDDGEPLCAAVIARRGGLEQLRVFTTMGDADVLAPFSDRPRAGFWCWPPVVTDAELDAKAEAEETAEGAKLTTVSAYVRR